jgi:hypothetical protein
MNYIVFPKQFPTLSDGTLIPCNDIKSDFKTVFNPLNTILEPFNDFYDKIILIIRHFLSNFTGSTKSLGSTESLSKDRTAQ